MSGIIFSQKISVNTSIQTNSALDPGRSASSWEEFGLAPKIDASELPPSQKNTGDHIPVLLKSFDFFNLSMDRFTPPGTPSIEGQPASPILPMEHLSLPLLATSHDQGNHLVDKNPSVVGLQNQEPRYSDFSDVFTEAEYREITSCYDIMGRDGWKTITANPIFHSRRAQVRDICQRLEDFDIEEWLRRRGTSRKVMDKVLDKKGFMSLAIIARQDLRVQSEVLESSTGVQMEAGKNSQMKHPYNKQIQALQQLQELLRSRNLKDHLGCSISEPTAAQESWKMTNEVKASKASQGSNKKEKVTSSYTSYYEEVMLAFDKKSKMTKRGKSSSSSSSNYGSPASVRSRSSWSSDIGEFPYAYPSMIPERRSFYDSDNYLGGRRQSPTMSPMEPMETDYPPFTVDSPQLPLYATVPLSSPESSSLSIKPRGISRLFHLPRKHQKA